MVTEPGSSVPGEEAGVVRLGCPRRSVGLTRVRVGAVLRARTISSQALRPLFLLYGHIITLKAICTLIRPAKAFVLRRGSFTPVVHQPTRTPANKHETCSDKVRHFPGISERHRTTMTSWICLHTAEDAGSIPASPTVKSGVLQKNYLVTEQSRER